jgi:hypothetical protein
MGLLLEARAQNIQGEKASARSAQGKWLARIKDWFFSNF